LLAKDGIMTETWYKEDCPECETHNWVCNGNEQDLSSLDVEAIKCRKCGHIFFLGDDMTFEILGYETADDALWVDGLEHPD
jgi:hypothetical protein